MNRVPDQAEGAALDWIVRTNDPEFDAWDEFTAWLEQAPSHADAYHRLADSEIALRPVIAEASLADEAVRDRRPRPRLALAASVALFAAVATTVVAPRLMPVDYATGPGELKTVSLGGADRLVMNGATKVTLSGWDRRHVRLDQGQVYLSLADATKGRVELTSGDLRLVDIGTRFEVSRTGHATRVVVSEGMVMADPGGAGLRISVGQRLDTEDGAKLLRAVPGDPNSAGAFERGQLLYADEALEQVAADLRRSTGVDFSTSAAISARRFSGTLSVAEIRRDPRSLGPLLGVSMHKNGQGWRLGVSE